MHAPTRAAAALATLVVFAVGGQAAARLPHPGGPRPAPGHNIFHPKGIAPGQGQGGGAHAGGGGGHHHPKNGNQQGCHQNSGPVDQETDTTKKDPKRGHKPKQDSNPDCITAKA